MKTFKKVELEAFLDHVCESLLISMDHATKTQDFSDSEIDHALALYCTYMLPMYEYLQQQSYFEPYLELWNRAYKAYINQGPDFKCYCSLCEHIVKEEH
jgi:hypothetical protein